MFDSVKQGESNVTGMDVYHTGITSKNNTVISIDSAWAGGSNPLVPTSKNGHLEHML